MSQKGKRTLLLLAAGMGSRYGGIKQIDGFGPNGETIMDYSLFDALRSGFTKIVFIVRDEILDQVKETFLPRLEGKAEVAFVIQSIDTFTPDTFKNPERKKPWGTAHATLCAKDVIHEPFAVINADDFYGQDAFRATIDFFDNETEGAHALVGYTLKNVLSDHGSVNRGCGESDGKGYLKSVVERINIVKRDGKIVATGGDQEVELSPETPTSMNFWCFYPTIFPIIENKFNNFLAQNHENPKAEFFIPLVANEMIEKGEGKIRIIDGGNTWFGVTYQEDKEAVSAKIMELVKQGKYPEKLWN